MKLSPLEKRILLHRLHSCDTIASVFVASVCDCEQCDSAEFRDMEDAAFRAAAFIESSADIAAFDSTDAAMCWALAEAVNGSTWIGCMIGNESARTITRHIEVGNRLAKKIEAITGISCEFPEH